MTDLRLPDYLEHIRDAAREAMELTKGMDRSAFLADRRTQLAIIALLSIIGEATGNILRRYAEFAQAHPEIPWADMRGQRNRIAHGYFDVNFDTIWMTTYRDLPSLLEKLPSPPAESGS